MGFVYERVPEEDREFFKSMGLKDCWGREGKCLTKRTKWCADREKNAYLVGIGGGYNGEMPYFYDLWWNSQIIRMEIERGSKGNVETGIEVIWFINRISVPCDIWEYKDKIVEIIEEAFSINRGWCEETELKYITVKINCTPEKVEVR